MTRVVFPGPGLKLERARRHIHGLEDLIAAFLARDPYRLIGVTNPQAERRRVVLRATEPIPGEIAAITGGAIHDLRSALDFPACDPAALNGDERRRARFPSREDVDGERAAMKKIATLRPGAIRMIRAMKSDKRVDDSLRGTSRS